MEEVPRELITVPKGGRPKALAKHVAVYMARLYYKKKLGKAYLADEELMRLFDISDPSVIRGMTGKASRALLKRFVVYREPDRNGLSMLIERARAARGPGRAVTFTVDVRDMHVWIWWDGLTKAIRTPIAGVRDSKELRQKWRGKWPPV